MSVAPPPALANAAKLLLVASFDLAGIVRRIRRIADLSQRELAQRLGLSKSMVAAVESGDRSLGVEVLVHAVELAGLRLTVLDAQGHEVTGMDPDGVRDLGYRRFPAHLDTRYSDAEWYQPLRYDRPESWYTFSRDREVRDRWRERDGTPPDHQLPQSGDSPAERRRAAARAACRREPRELTGPPPFICTCPPECAQLDRGERPVHAPHCQCGCDVD